MDPSLWIRPIPSQGYQLALAALIDQQWLPSAHTPQSPALDLAFLLCSRTMAATSESRYEPSEVVLSGYMAKTAHAGVEISVNGVARGLGGCSDGS